MLMIVLQFDFILLFQGTGEWNGLIKQIQDHRADMVLTSLKITPKRSEVVDFSIPFLETGITIMVSIRKGNISPTAFLGLWSSNISAYHFPIVLDKIKESKVPSHHHLENLFEKWSHSSSIKRVIATKYWENAKIFISTCIT